MMKTTFKTVRKTLAFTLAIVFILSMIPFGTVFAATPNLSTYNITSGADDDTSVPPSPFADGRIWTDRSVTDNGDGTFTVKISALGKSYSVGAAGTEYDPPNHPLAAAATLKIYDPYYSDDFDSDISEVVADQTIWTYDSTTKTWSLPAENLSIDGEHPTTITYILSLKAPFETEKPYITHDPAQANFKVTDDNPYYWSERIPHETKYKADINWRNNADYNAIIQLTIKNDDAIGAEILTVGKNNEYVEMATFNNLIANPDPNKPLIYSDISTKGAGAEKKYQLYVGKYNPDKGVYDVFISPLFVGNNGGNEQNIPDWIGETWYSDPQPINGNDGQSNVSHRLENKGSIYLEYRTVDVEDITITVNKVVNKSAYADVPDDVEFKFILKDSDQNTVDTATISGAEYKSGTTTATLTIPGETYANVNVEKTYTITEVIENGGNDWGNNKQVFNVVVTTNGYTINEESGISEITFNNEYTYVPTGKLVVKKEWMGVSDADKENVYFTLYENGEVYSNERMLSAGNGWEAEFEGLTLGATYYAIEASLDNSDITPIISNTGETTLDKSHIDNFAVLTFSNGYNELRGSITVNKKWIDENFDNDMPTAINVTVKGNEYEVTKSISADDGWSATFSGLKIGTYVVSESDLAGYKLITSEADRTVILSDNGGDATRKVSVTLTNEYAPVAKLSINKEWIDDPSTRPASIDVVISDTDGVYKTITLKADNDWQWSEVVPYGTYTIAEELGAYASYYSVSGADGSVTLDKANPEDGFNITNKDIESAGTITVTKIWATDRPEIIPSELTIVLTGSEPVTLTAADADQNGNWVHKFTGLALTGEYTVYEYSSDPNFDLFGQSISGSVVLSPTNRSGAIVITNTYADGTITVVKDWEGPVDPQKPTSVEITLYGKYVEDSSVDPMSFEPISVELNADNSWSHTFYSLPLNNFKYTIIETPIPYYNTSISEDEILLTGSGASASATVYVTNTFTDPKGTINVEKEYIGAKSPAGGVAFPEVDFYLLKNGVRVSFEEGQNYGASNWDENGYAVFTTSNLKATINNLPFGYPRANVYSVREIVSGLGSDYSLDSNGGRVRLTRTEAVGEITIINSYAIPTGDLTVIKDWQDTGFEFARPANGITININRGIAGEGSKFFDSVNLTGAEGKWSYTFGGLELYDENGNAYLYSISETGINTRYYSVTLPDNGAGFALSQNIDTEVTVINTADSSTIRGIVTVNKDWVGEDGSAFPANLKQSVNVRLLANGRPVNNRATLNEGNNWTASWRVPVADRSGNRIEYSVVELTESEHWAYSVKSSTEDSTISADTGEQVLTLTNKYVPYDGKGVDLGKVGKDDVILVNGEAIIPYTLTITNNGNKTLTDIVVTDTLGEGMTLVADSWIGAQLDEENSTERVLVFNVSGTLAPEESITIEYSVLVNAIGDYDNSAIVRAVVVGDGNHVDDDANTTSNVIKPELGITKVAAQRSQTADGSATYTFTLRVYNQGAVDLTNVEVKDIMTGPAGATMTYTYSGDYEIDEDGVVTFFIGDLPIDASVEIVYTVTVDINGNYDNAATVIGWFNDGEDSLTFTAEEDVTLRRPTPTPVVPGDPGTPVTPTTPTPDPEPVVADVVEEQTPLADVPEIDVPLAALPPDPEEFMDVIIDDPDVPLSTLPQTGRNELLPLGILGIGAVALAGGILLNGKKKQDEDMI